MPGQGSKHSVNSVLSVEVSDLSLIQNSYLLQVQGSKKDRAPAIVMISQEKESDRILLCNCFVLLIKYTFDSLCSQQVRSTYWPLDTSKQLTSDVFVVSDKSIDRRFVPQSRERKRERDIAIAQQESLTDCLFSLKEREKQVFASCLSSESEASNWLFLSQSHIFLSFPESFDVLRGNNNNNIEKKRHLKSHLKNWLSV